MMGKSHSTKGQAMSFDFILALTLFIIMLAIFFLHFGRLEKPDTALVEMQEEVIGISNILMGEGSPENWNADNVILPGITNGDYRLDTAKWDMLASMDTSEFNNLFKSKYSLLIFLEDKNECIPSVLGTRAIGSASIPNIACPQRADIILDATHIVPISRILIYNATPTKLTIYAWK